MRMLNKQLAIAVIAAIVLALTACSSSNAEKKQVASNMPVSQTKTEAIKPSGQTENSQFQVELDNAKKTAKAVFVVVTGNGVTETEKAMIVAKGAVAIYKNAVVLQINRDDEANASLVSQWRLSGAPLPLILAISPKGTLSGGKVLSQATSDNIAALIPSPKLEEVYAAIGSGQPAIVVFTKKSLSDRTEVLQACKEAVSKLNNKAVIVEVDLDDRNETAFINQLRIDKAATASTTLVINTQGQVSGTSKTVPDAAKLVASATQPVKSGCGPGCGPAGCGK